MPGAILHLECATAYGGSVRCLESFLKHRTDRTHRHLVGLYSPLAEQDRLRECSDGVWVAPVRRELPGPRSLSLLVHTVRLARWIGALIEREGVRLVRLNNAPVAHVAALYAVRGTGVPCVSWLRSFPRPSEDFRSGFAPRPDVYVAMSKAVHAAYLADGVPPERLRLVYDGAPVPDRPTVRNGAATAIRIGTLGRLVAWKGLDTVVEAASLVVRDFPGARFEIVGNDDPAEPGFRAGLVREIERRGLTGSVSVQDFVADPSAFVASIDCLVNPSFPAEPFGMSIVEAMADACPVIATNSGGPAEIIEDGRSGLLVPPEDPSALAAAILRLARDPAYRRVMGEEARRQVASRFEVATKVAEQEALLMSLASV